MSDPSISAESGIFFPHYINQPRLLDLYAILNGGYPEYEEVQNSATSSSAKKANAKASANGGFHIFKIAGSINGEFEKDTSREESTTTHRVQTITSILDLTIKELRRRRYFSPIEKARAGSFVLLPVNLQINSIKGLLQEAKDLVALSKDMISLGKQNQRHSKQARQDPQMKQIEQIVRVTKELFNAEEIVSDCGDYAVFGNVDLDNLYESGMSDITGIDLHCLAQVKRVFPNGTQLMKNTVFSKLRDEQSKTDLFKALEQLTNGNLFEYETTAILEILNKPVYQIEVVALFQQAPYAIVNAEDNKG